jgi:hypothetical protein
MRRYSNMDWSDPNIYLIFIGLSILLVPIYKRELLIKKDSFKIILMISIISFLAALLFDLSNFDQKYWGVLSLYFPLYIVLSYRLIRKIFVRINKREPIDTAFDFKDITPWSDRLFNILYFTQAILIPAFFVFVLRFV